MKVKYEHFDLFITELFIIEGFQQTLNKMHIARFAISEMFLRQLCKSYCHFELNGCFGE